MSADINREGEIRGHYAPYMYIIQQPFASDKALWLAKIASHVFPGALLFERYHPRRTCRPTKGGHDMATLQPMTRLPQLIHRTDRVLAVLHAQISR